MQVGALFYPDYLRQEINRCLTLKNQIFKKVYGKPAAEPEETYRWAIKYGEILKPHICDSIALLNDARKAGKVVLLEGQLGALRDIIYGIYPYTTSSSTIAGFGPVGAGYFNPEVPEVTGVMKAFSTCVGEGPFTTEIHGELAHQIRETSVEYGALTGRPRRIGWFDAVASRYGTEVSGATEIALTKLDSLSGLDTLKICTSYRIGSRTLDSFPITPELIQAEPVYTEVPGWQENIRNVRQFTQLPAAAQKYVERIERLVERPIKFVSVGPHREAMIER